MIVKNNSIDVIKKQFDTWYEQQCYDNDTVVKNMSVEKTIETDDIKVSYSLSIVCDTTKPAITDESVKLFMDDCIEFSDDYDTHVLRSSLYQAYVTYCKQHNLLPVHNRGNEGFSNLIKPYINDRLTRSNGTSLVRGIKLNIKGGE